MSETTDLLEAIRKRASLDNPKPWGEHDLSLELDWYKRIAVPFLLKQYDDILAFSVKQCQDVHDLGLQINGLKLQQETCTFPGCGRRAYSNGLCNYHFNQ